MPSTTPAGTDSESTVGEGPGTGSVDFSWAEDVGVTVSLSTGWMTDEIVVRKRDSAPIIHLAF